MRLVDPERFDDHDAFRRLLISANPCLLRGCARGKSLLPGAIASSSVKETTSE
jgi:hypothetical protein